MGGALMGVAALNDSFNGDPPASAGLNQGGMPGMSNSATGAMEMQKSQGVADVLGQTSPTGGGPVAPPPSDTGLKDFLSPHPTDDMQTVAMNQPSGEMQLANEVIGATPVDDGTLGNQRTQKTINNANAAIGVGSTINGMFQGDPPSTAGIAGRPFQMPNSVLGLQSLFRR